MFPYLLQPSILALPTRAPAGVARLSPVADIAMAWYVAAERQGALLLDRVAFLGTSVRKIVSPPQPPTHAQRIGIAVVARVHQQVVAFATDFRVAVEVLSVLPLDLAAFHGTTVP